MAGYIGSNISVASPGAEKKFTYIATAGQTLFSQCSYSVGYLHVFHNGVRLVEVTDYTATTGNSFTLTVAANVGDEIVAISYGTFSVADAYTKSESDDRYLPIDLPIMSGQMGTITGPTGPAIVAFDDFWFQRGIEYNSTTKRFTVSRTGIYRITWNAFTHSAGTATVRVFISVNSDTPTNQVHKGQAYKSAAGHQTLSLISVVPLNANDYIIFYIAEGTLYNATNDRFNQFTIEMIGE